MWRNHCLKTEKLKVLELVKELNDVVDKYLVNFPNKEIELKRKIREASYELLLITYEANVTKNALKKIDIQERAISLIKFIDYLINKCYDKQIINGKKYFKYGELLENILKYYIGWINSTRKTSGNNLGEEVTSSVT